MQSSALTTGCMVLLVLLHAETICAAANNSAPAEPAAATPAVHSNPDFNFDLLDTAPQANDPIAQANAERIERLGKVRRRILLTHQMLGFVALASLTATVVVGHLNYYDRYVSADFSNRYQTAHMGLATATTALFGTTAILALAAPNPYPKKYRFDTAMVHRIALAAATAGMLTQIALGAVTGRRDGYLDQPGLALGHVVVGYATWAFMTTGVIAYMF
jgi:hypothetical protein